MYDFKNSDVRTQYDVDVSGSSYDNDYEYKRWFIRARNRAEYAMTYQAIKYHTKDLRFDRCLEVGPGPGTWSRLVYRANPQAQFTLVDISEAMRKQFVLEMRELSNVNYQVSDVMEFGEGNTYDLFFSSRAVEYFDDKPAFFARLKNLINPGGTGVMITKNPYHGIRKDKRAAHQGQIPMSQMKQMLEENGFTNITFYPVVYRVPILSRFTSEIAEYLLEKNISSPLNVRKTNRMVESYLVSFKKPA